MSTKKNGSYQAEDILCFQKDIKIIPHENKTLILSVETGNWIVLYNDYQLKYFNCLLDGTTIGNVYEIAEAESKLSDFLKVLSFIYAREFAQVGKVPQSKVIDASKYLSHQCL